MFISSHPLFRTHKKFTFTAKIKKMAFPLALIGAIYQAGVGIGQQMDAKAMEAANVRPEYKTPEPLKQATAISKAAFADPRFAGQAQLEAQVGQNLSQGLEAAQSRGNGMAQVASIVAAGNQANQNIAAEGARQQRQDQADYQNMLKIMAASKDQEWQLNKFAPYSDKYNEAREMKGAGQQNLFAAMDSIAAVTSRFQGAGGQQDTTMAANAALSSNATTQSQQYSDVLLAKQMAQWNKMANSGQTALSNFYSVQ